MVNILFLGETDWKVLVIDVDDPIAPEVNGNYHIHFLLIIQLCF